MLYCMDTTETTSLTCPISASSKMVKALITYISMKRGKNPGGLPKNAKNPI